MTYDRFQAFCLSLPAASMVVQWGGAHVFKVGDKVFAIAGHDDGGFDGAYVFKTSDLSFEILIETGVAERAPYLPRGGWLALKGRDTQSDGELEAYIAQSHTLVAAGLSKTRRRALGLEP